MNIFKDFLTGSKQLSSLSRQFLHFQIEPGSSNNVAQYQDFQQRVATFLPLEYDRPIIHLEITSDQFVNTGSSIAIIGGMGPLSDAALIQKVVRYLDEGDCCNYHIDLLSIPPPRSMGQVLFGGGRYLYHLMSFLRSRVFTHIFLASNTAHVYFSFFRSLSSSSTLEDLTKLVTLQIAERKGTANTLILGTILGHRHHLYEQQFQKAGLQFHVLSASDQVIIQELIDSTKAGTNSEQTALILLGYIETARQQYGIDTVLLGCTELSLILGEEKSHHLTQGGINIIDTEVEFAHLIATICIKDNDSHSGK